MVEIVNGRPGVLSTNASHNHDHHPFVFVFVAVPRKLNRFSSGYGRHLGVRGRDGETALR